MKPYCNNKFRSVDIIIPFYKHEELVPPLFTSIFSCVEDLYVMNIRLVIINDSPGYKQLEVALENELEQCKRLQVNFKIIRNNENLGFVQSANKGLEQSMIASHDAILLNSDTILTPSALKEMQRVAYLDSMIGFVSPRSNNATICDFPIQEEYKSASFDKAYKGFKELHSCLPELTYVPTGVGFCLYIKHYILQEFGLLDKIYGKGYNEENDLIFRANRYGYRAVLANHAYVYHVKSVSFEATKSIHELDKKNSNLLAFRYPEYITNIEQYFSSPYYRAEKLVSGLLKDENEKTSIVFDLMHLGAFYNGTAEASLSILKSLSENWNNKFEFFVRCHKATWLFHKLDILNNVTYLSPENPKICGIAFRVGQPFKFNDLLFMSEIATYNVFFMLDTIAWDSFYLRNKNLHDLWNFVFRYADGVIYQSNFTAKQFGLRFPRRKKLKSLISPHSLNLCEYNSNFYDVLNPSNQLDSYILIIGNNYLHKYITPTVDALSSAFPDKKILVIGEKNHIKNNVIFYKSGLIDEKFINKAYCNAQFVIFPSHYEGFGFPLIKSLAYHKPVMVKESELWQEMKIRLKNENIFFYQTTQDLINQLKSNGFPISTKIASSNENDGWERSANEMADFFSKLCEDKNNLVQNISLRIEHLQLLQKREDNNNFLKLRSVTQIRYSLKIKSFFAQVFWKIKTQNAMRICKKSPLFDRAWYMNEYPDVVISGQDPILHYIKYGAKEGRDPGPIFSTSNYFIAHPEIIKTGINPLVHHAYVIKGRKPRH